MTMSRDPEIDFTATRPTSIGRYVAVLYGVVSYAIFFGTFLYAVGFVSDLPVPKGINQGTVVPLPEALIVNMLLLSLFAVQHSVMARPQFKQRWVQFVPKSVERSTYVLLASLTLLLLFWQWRPIPEVIWRIDDPLLATATSLLSMFGWFFALTSTFMINHFELFGLSQVIQNLRRKETPAPQFRTPIYYRFVRHPIYLGFIIAFWAAPTMTAGHLLFAGVTTAYIFVGIVLEESDLIELFGAEYRSYKERVGMLLPWRRLD